MEEKGSARDFKMLLLVGIIVSVITFEITIIRIYGFVNPAPLLSVILSLFVIGILICSFGHVYMSFRLRDLTRKFGKVRFGSKKTISYVLGLQIFLIGLMIVLLYQVLISLSYSIILTSTIFLISYMFGIISLVFTSWKFTKWILTKTNYVLVVNTIAVFTILVNVVFALLMVVDGLPHQPTSVHWNMGPVHYSYKSIFVTPYQISSIIAFIGIWIAMTILLKNYSSRLGKRKFWLFISLPMIYFLAQFQPYLLNLIITYAQSEAATVAIVYTSLFGASKTIGAILFGYAIWNTSRKVYQTELRGFMRMAAYGMTLLIISNQATSLLNYLFPPFGILAVSFLGISSFMFLVGLYSSALSVANDLQLRHFVRKSVQNEFALVSNMGDAEMEERIKGKIVGAAGRLSHVLVKETGIETTLSDSEILEYAIKAINEVKLSKKESRD
jgi:hypothetical protein